MMTKQKYRVVYLVSCILYGVIGLIGLIGEPIAQKDANNFIITHYTIILVLLTAVSGAAAAWFFPKAFPKGWSVQKFAGKIFIPVVFFLLAFCVSLGMLRFYNSHVGKRPVVYIKGKIERKWSVKSRRSTSYYLDIIDDSTGTLRSFKIKRKIYQRLSVPGFSFAAVFHKGSLGILYSHGE